MYLSPYRVCAFIEITSLKGAAALLQARHHRECGSGALLGRSTDRGLELRRAHLDASNHLRPRGPLAHTSYAAFRSRGFKGRSNAQEGSEESNELHGDTFCTCSDEMNSQKGWVKLSDSFENRREDVADQLFFEKSCGCQSSFYIFPLDPFLPC